jgi:single-strand DNA-binding protein
MSGVNMVVLMGRLTRDPEVKNSKGLDIANFSIATSDQWKDDSGEKHEKVEYHNIVAFKKTAELVGKYLTKGRQVHVVGKLQTRSWDDDSGVKKYKTEIVASNIQFISDGGTQKTTESQTEFGDTAPAAPSFNSTEEIPF